MPNKKFVRDKEIPEKKKKAVEQALKLIEKNRTLMIASIENLPSSQFQKIRKKLKDVAKIKVLKKNIIFRIIDSIEKGRIKELKKHIEENCALLFSNLDPFELSAKLSESKTPAKAKIGQQVPDDIIIEAGPTELLPGPVISEFGNLGVKIIIKDGKINIKENKKILKKGEKVTQAAASIMSKLDIKPLLISLEPIAAYDSKEDETYTGIKVDKEKTLEEIKNVFIKAKAFAIKIVYICKETIKDLIRKACLEEKALSKFTDNNVQNKSNKLKEEK